LCNPLGRTNDKEPLQVSATLALDALAYQHAGNRHVILEEGGLTALVDALRRHMQDRDLQKCVCATLRTLTRADKDLHSSVAISALRRCLNAGTASGERAGRQGDSQLGVRVGGWASGFRD